MVSTICIPFITLQIVLKVYDGLDDMSMQSRFFPILDIRKNSSHIVNNDRMKLLLVTLLFSLAITNTIAQWVFGPMPPPPPPPPPGLFFGPRPMPGMFAPGMFGPRGGFGGGFGGRGGMGGRGGR
ncbi:unnamed protein product, partial [Strongylus vulgaris]